MKTYYREFPQPDGSVKICEQVNGVRLPTRYVKAGEEKPDYRPPSMLRKAANFTKAAVKHVAAGSPQATDEQVAERFAICQSCPMFKATGEGQGECSKCGCGLKAVGVAGVSKLRWADQACPIGKWKAIAPTTPSTP